ncbi:MAG: DUF2064 domain-containing protein, partial [Bacteroidota bacterium]
DCPGVTSDLLVEAFSLLKENDVVLGPALDGGYYLLGTKSVHESLFREMQWSIDSVAEETRLRAKKANLSIGELPELSDVD